MVSREGVGSLLNQVGTSTVVSVLNFQMTSGNHKKNPPCPIYMEMFQNASSMINGQTRVGSVAS